MGHLLETFSSGAEYLYTKSFHAFRFPCPETKINSNKKCFSEKYRVQPRDYIEELKFDNLTP